MNNDSGMVNGDSGKTGKSVHVEPEWVFTLNQNRCSRCARMGVHDGPEYATSNVDDFSWFSDRSVSNHKKFERACEILGMGPGKDIKEYKKKRKILVSQYHSDKVEGCSEAIKKYAKEQTQLLNVAMDVIEKYLKNK